MKKNKLASFLLTAVILLCAKNFYLTPVVKISMRSTAAQWEFIHVYYKTNATAQEQHVKDIVKAGGRNNFKIYAKNVQCLRIDMPSSSVIRSVKFDGQTKVFLDRIPEHNDFSPFPVQPKLHFDFKLFAMGAFLLYAMLYTIIGKQRIFEQKTPKMQNLEMLRLLFMVGIVVFHASPFVGIFSMGGLGVEFFFILSGFFLLLTFKPERATASFVKSKAIHFWPLTMLVALFNGKIALIPANMLFLQGTGLAASVPVQGWYLGVLFWASLFYFYVLKVYKAETAKLIIAVTTFVSYYGFKQGWGGNEILRGLAGVGLGYFLGCLYLQIKDKNVYTGAGYTIAEAIALSYSVGLMFVKQISPDNKIQAVIAFAVLIVLFALKRGKVSRFFEKPVFARLACCSFSIYMTHIEVTRSFVFHICDQYPNVFDEYPHALMILVWCICYIFGLMIWRYFEKPATDKLKKIIYGEF